MENFEKGESQFDIRNEIQKIKRRNKLLIISLILLMAVVAYFIIVNNRMQNNNCRILFTLDQGQNTSLSAIVSKNDFIYSRIARTQMVEPVVFKPYFDKSILVKKYSDDLVKYISKLKTQLIAYTEFGIKNESEAYVTWSISDTISLVDIESKNNSKKPMEILIGNSDDVSTGEGIVLKRRLEEYKKKMIDIFIKGTRDRECIEKEGLLNLANEYSYSGDKVENWVEYHFKNQTLIADIAFLNKLLIDIKTLEGIVVSRVFSQVDVDNFTLSAVSPFVISESNYIPLGTKYKARILMAAYDAMKTPDIFIGDTITHVGKLLDKANDERGMCVYTALGSSIGQKKYTGWISIVKPGNIIPDYYNFSGSYVVFDTNKTLILK